MNFVGTTSGAIWRQRVYGSFFALVFYLLLHFFQLVQFGALSFAALFGTSLLYFLALFAGRETWVRWSLAFFDMFTISLMIRDTGGVYSPFLIMIPVWFIGVALANLVDGETRPIPWMLAMAAVSAIVGAWENLTIIAGVMMFVALAASGAAALTLSLERRASRRDPLLTMLYNRSAGLNRLEEMCQSGEAVSVAFVDLTEFKSLNDRNGHKTGDEVLLEVGRRLAASVRPSDLVARIGGDEFLIASQHPDLQARLEQIFAQPIQTSHGALQVGGDVGSISVNRQDEVDDILERADALMYSRKRAAKALA